MRNDVHVQNIEENCFHSCWAKYPLWSWHLSDLRKIWHFMHNEKDMTFRACDILESPNFAQVGHVHVLPPPPQSNWDAHSRWFISLSSTYIWLTFIIIVFTRDDCVEVEENDEDIKRPGFLWLFFFVEAFILLFFMLPHFATSHIANLYVVAFCLMFASYLLTISPMPPIKWPWFVSILSLKFY